MIPYSKQRNILNKTIEVNIMTKQITEATTAIVRDVEFFWANVKKPHAPFGTQQWDVQLRTTDKETKKQLESLGVKMKEADEGYFFANVKRKTVKANGDAMDPPQVIDSKRMPVDDNIGNGSKGHVKLFSYPYKVGGRSGIGCMLVALQVVEHIKYEGKTGVDFDDESGSTDEEF